ncbi:ABC transporter substrate-binding protein [Actinoplanes sp. ATCC 53533]|uniref:substrate-binding periplasmic protein n=1 Tax=Actinoplanes sp. ATCC 53533 TaxID=1288362 RepID=UPI0018F6FD43|nr:ABC transporter substrate-binding protein [Actinoplanes sp. ATCC 53533]
MKLRKLTLLTAAVIVSLPTLAGCGGTDPAAEGTSAAGCPAGNPYQLIEPCVITAGTQSEQPPFAFADAGGSPKGFSIDLAEEAARRLGLRVDYKITNLQGILTGLTADKYDMGVAGVGATDERKKSVDFVRPYFWSFTAVMTKTDNAAAALPDFGGKRVGVVSGSVQETFANTNVPGAIVVKFKDQPSAVGQLLSGGIDAFVVGGPDAQEYLSREKTLKIAARADSTQGTSFPVRKGKTALVNALDEQIDNMITDGTYLTLYGRWFTEPVSAKLQEIRPGLTKVLGSPAPSAAG